MISPAGYVQYIAVLRTHYHYHHRRHHWGLGKKFFHFYFSSARDMEIAWEEKWMIRNSHLSSFLFEKLKEMELGKNETAFCDQLIRIFSGSQRNMNEIKRSYIRQGCVKFLTISDPRWDQPVSDLSIFFTSGQLILMQWTHFMQNIWRKWPESSIFKIRNAVATKTTSLHWR